jgi:hypothetical protein
MNARSAQSGFWRPMVRISARTSLVRHGRPPRLTDLPGPETGESLSGATDDGCGLDDDALDCQSFQTAHSQAHNNRSAGVSLGRLTERCRTPN